MAIMKYGGGPNPPVRLDKWQNIIGVGWPSDGEYVCGIWGVDPTYATAFGADCGTAEQARTKEVPWAYQYLTSLRYLVESFNSFYTRDASGTWTTGLDPGLTLTNDVRHDVTNTYAPFTYCGSNSTNGGIDGVVTWATRGIPKWVSSAGTSTGVEVPNNPGVTFDEALAMTVHQISDIFIDAARCTFPSGYTSALIGAYCTGLQFQQTPEKTEPDYYEPSQAPHSALAVDFSSMKLVEADGREWLPVAAKVTNQKTAAESPKAGSTGIVYVLFKRQPAPEPTP